MPWTKLSETLTRPKHPEVCQSCGDLAPPRPDAGVPGRDLPAAVLLRRWREHDMADRPTAAVVVLCPGCSRKLIDPHPRLYAELGWCEPDPGSMPMCGPCRHRDGTACRMATGHGGPGLELMVTEPTSVHLCRVPRSKSGWVKVWPAWPRSCNRFEPGGAGGINDGRRETDPGG